MHAFEAPENASRMAAEDPHEAPATLHAARTCGSSRKTPQASPFEGPSSRGAHALFQEPEAKQALRRRDEGLGVRSRCPSEDTARLLVGGVLRFSELGEDL